MKPPAGEPIYVTGCFSHPSTVIQQSRRLVASRTDDSSGGHAMICDRLERRKPRGFTRTDLLAALTVTLLLALLQLSAANHDTTQRDTAVCLSNLRRLTQAWLMYASDNRDYFPPNLNDGGRSNWVYGTVGSLPDGTNNLSLVDGRFSKLGPYSRDPAIYQCPADQTSIRVGGRTYFRIRDFSANLAVGTKSDGVSPVDGAWLDGTYSHTANRTWYTFAKLSDVVRPNPARLWMLIDEDASSINDGGFACNHAPIGDDRLARYAPRLVRDRLLCRRQRRDTPLEGPAHGCSQWQRQ